MVALADGLQDRRVDASELSRRHLWRLIRLVGERGQSEHGKKAEWAAWQPTVTALVPCFNSAEFISRTLDSLTAQTWSNMEILIGDDCSSDDTVHIVSEFAQGRDNVRLVRRDQNMGWLRNSNDLMAQAKGELMFFAFHDDIVAPEYVEKLVEALRGNPQAVLSYSDLLLTELDGRRWVLTLDGLSGLSSSLASSWRENTTRGFRIEGFSGRGCFIASGG